MKNILHIQSSSRYDGSVTRETGMLTVQHLKKAIPDAQVIERDLVKSPIPHASPEFLSGMFSGQPNAPALALSDQLIKELFASDVIVLEAPMYNFNIPSVLKAWIDQVVRIGKTFQYGAAGPEGLVKGKKAIIVLGRGGVYTEGSAKVMDHQEPYLRTILGFIGITDVQSVYIEGTGMGPDKTKDALANAKRMVEKIRA